jgi:hypothetical protein
MKNSVPKPLSPSHAHNTKRSPLLRIAVLVLFGLGIVCVGLWTLVLLQSGFLGGQSAANLTATALAQNNQACQTLIEQAMQESGDFCKNIGTNQLCYGNVSVQADLAQGTNQRFAQQGDIIDVDILRRLSAAPLDLQNHAWGIAIFKVTANLPRSLPGQTVTMMVFGNTTLGKEEPGLHTFYFFSDTGQVICDAVPFDGLMITMPNGVGARFNINGSELVLTGNASVTAIPGGEMNISLYNGSAQVTADGQSQIFGPGQQVSIPLGGSNGLETIGPPSEPTPLSDDDLTIACTIAGQNCDLTPIPTIPADAAEATLSSELRPTQETVVATPSATSTQAPSATAMPSMTPFPSLTRVPSKTATRVPTRKPSDTHQPPSTATKMNTAAPTQTPSNTFTPTYTGTVTATFTDTFTPTDTATITATPTFTNTFTLTPTETATPTFTSVVPTDTSTPTPTSINCSLITMQNLSISGNQLSVEIVNGMTSVIRLASFISNWPDVPESQQLNLITLGTQNIWEGTMTAPNAAPEAFTAAFGLRQINASSSDVLTMNFSEILVPEPYSLTINFESIGCPTTITLP